MAIKWSAVKVSEAMDEVEQQVLLADQFIAEARTKAQAAKKIPNLPQYMEDRINSLISQIERIDKIKSVLQSVRDNIPKADLEEQRRLAEYGSQQSLV